MRKDVGESLLREPFLILLLPSYGYRPLAASWRASVLRAMLGGTGGADLQLRGAATSSSSTITTIQTPIWPLMPISGVQWIHRPRPSSCDLVNQRTLAVTPRPSANAAVSSSRTRGEPPIRSRKGDWRMPGTRCAGEAKRIRRDGYGRTRRYCFQFCQNQPSHINHPVT